MEPFQFLLNHIQPECAVADPIARAAGNQVLFLEHHPIDKDALAAILTLAVDVRFEVDSRDPAIATIGSEPEDAVIGGVIGKNVAGIPLKELRCHDWIE